MTDGLSLLADLLVNCEARGIRLSLASDGALTIDAPQDALTPDVLDRLKAHKANLLTLLLRASGFDADNAPAAEPVPAALVGLTKEVCRCGSTKWRDVPIHDGQSVRRDCGRCGRFINFPVWYGALQNEK